jgi:acyl carrier protein
VSDLELTKERLKAVFQRVLELGPGTDPETVLYKEESRWDSVAHLQLITALEAEFEIVIGNEDVLHMTSFAAILELVLRLGHNGPVG